MQIQTASKLRSLIRRAVERFSPEPIGGRIYDIVAAIDEQALRSTSLDSVPDSLNASKHKLFTCLFEYTRSTTAAQVLTLKVLNLCLAKYQFRARNTHLIARPFGVIVDPSNGCNLACPGCVHSRGAQAQGLFDWKPGMLTESRISPFLAQFGPYAVQTLFCNYGEPLLNPNTPKFIRRAKSYLMSTVLSTNLAMPRFDAEAYVQSGLDYMILSIDGATQHVYERFRKQGNIEIVYQNIRKLIQTRRRLGKSTPVVCWQYLAFEHNVHEIFDAVELARRFGIDVFRVASPFDVRWDDPGIQSATIAPFTLQFNTDVEQDLAGNWNPFPGELDAERIECEFQMAWSQREARLTGDTGPSKHTCHWLYKNIVMDAHGRIFPCASAPAAGKELTFATFPNAGGDLFNTDNHRLARLAFANREAYESENPAREPHCVNCEWNQTKTDIDTEQVEQYLRCTGKELFHKNTIRMLTEWPVKDEAPHCTGTLTTGLVESPTVTDKSCEPVGAFAGTRKLT